MARPDSYRRVGHAPKRCGTCKHFLRRNEWCKRFKFSASDDYVCTKWVKGNIGDEEESDLKQRYRKATTEIIDRQENYAVEYTPKPKSEDYEVGWMYRYFAKQAGNPYGDIIEISPKAYRSRGSTTTGIDGSYYEVVEVQWTIGGDIKEVQRANSRIANYIEGRYPRMLGIKEYLYSNLVRFWEGGKKA